MSFADLEEMLDAAENNDRSRQILSTSIERPNRVMCDVVNNLKCNFFLQCMLFK